jgi:hypothetical protein
VIFWYQGLDIDRDAADFKDLLRLLAPGENYPDGCSADSPPRIPALHPKQPEEERKLWAWKHLASEPAVIRDVWCRVTHSSMIPHLVLKRVEFGYEDLETGVFTNEVKVVLASGQELRLPLSPEMVDSRWVSFAGYFGEKAHAMWPLRSDLDSGITIAFVYEVDPDGTLHRWRDQPIGDPDEQEARKIMEAAERELLKNPGKGKVAHAAIRDGDGFAPVEMSVPAPWGTQIRQGRLMPLNPDAAAIGAKVPSEASAKTDPTRILVVLSFAVCKQRADFDPGGIGSQARCYPQIMVKANVPLLRVEGTVRLDRPETTTMMAPPEGMPASGPVSCCLAYDGAEKEIRSLFVADDNDVRMDGIPDFLPASLVPPMPFWGNFFAYFQADAFANNANTPVHFVRSDRPDEVVDRGHVFRVVQKVLPGITEVRDYVRKLPRQGEFDNVHLAPRLRLERATHMIIDDQVIAIDRDELRMSDISMAPICAHDCYHLHTRWGENAPGFWAHGWGPNGPYTVPGAPMVPAHHNVWIRMRSDNALSYHVRAQHEDPARVLEAGEWQIILHQGTGYLIQLSWKGYLINTSFDGLAEPRFFAIPNPSDNGRNLRVMGTGDTVRDVIGGAGIALSLGMALLIPPAAVSSQLSITPGTVLGLGQYVLDDDHNANAQSAVHSYAQIPHGESTALFYWHARYYVRPVENYPGKYEVAERISYAPGGLDMVRNAAVSETSRFWEEVGKNLGLIPPGADSP